MKGEESAPQHRAPVLLMRMSILPNSFRVSSTAAVMLSGCLTSKHKGRHRRPDTADSFWAA